VVVDEQGNEDESKPLLWSERTSLLAKCLTEPTLLEMYEKKTSQDLSVAAICGSATNEDLNVAAEQIEDVGTQFCQAHRPSHRPKRGDWVYEVWSMGTQNGTPAS